MWNSRSPGVATARCVVPATSGTGAARRARTARRAGPRPSTRCRRRTPARRRGPGSRPSAAARHVGQQVADLRLSPGVDARAPGRSRCGQRGQHRLGGRRGVTVAHPGQDRRSPSSRGCSDLMVERPTPGRNRMGTITTTDGVEIFYKDWGSGQPIVFSHGWPLSSDDWDAQLHVLPAARLPGHRPRPPRPRPLDADRRRPRHGPLRRRPRRADRRTSTCTTPSTSGTPPAAARSCATSPATARAAWPRPC